MLREWVLSEWGYFRDVGGFGDFFRGILDVQWVATHVASTCAELRNE